VNFRSPVLVVLLDHLFELGHDVAGAHRVEVGPPVAGLELLDREAQRLNSDRRSL
jgi:hypothetical protein